MRNILEIKLISTSIIGLKIKRHLGMVDVTLYRRLYLHDMIRPMNHSTIPQNYINLDESSYFNN
jgi:hypothetical protein